MKFIKLKNVSKSYAVITTPGGPISKKVPFKAIKEEHFTDGVKALVKKGVLAIIEDKPKVKKEEPKKEEMIPKEEAPKNLPKLDPDKKVETKTEPKKEEVKKADSKKAKKNK